MALTSPALSDSELPDSVRHIVKCGVSFDKFFIVIWSSAGFSRIWPCLEHFFFFCALRSRGALHWASCSVLALSLGGRVYKQLYGSPRTSTGLAQDAWRWKGGIQVQSYSCQVMRTKPLGENRRQIWYLYREMPNVFPWAVFRGTFRPFPPQFSQPLTRLDTPTALSSIPALFSTPTNIGQQC